MNEFWHILTDPAHMAAEIVSHLVIEAVILSGAVPFIKKAVRRHDKRAHGKPGTCHEHGDALVWESGGPNEPTMFGRYYCPTHQRLFMAALDKEEDA